MGVLRHKDMTTIFDSTEQPKIPRGRLRFLKFVVFAAVTAGVFGAAGLAKPGISLLIRGCLSLSVSGVVLLLIVFERYANADRRFEAILRRGEPQAELCSWLHERHITMKGVEKENADSYTGGLFVCLSIAIFSLSTLCFSPGPRAAREWGADPTVVLAVGVLILSAIITGFLRSRLDSGVKRLLHLVSSAPSGSCKAIWTDWNQSEKEEQTLKARRQREYYERLNESRRRYEQSYEGKARTVAERRQRSRGNPSACDHEWHHQISGATDLPEGYADSTVSYDECVWCGSKKNMIRSGRV